MRLLTRLIFLAFSFFIQKAGVANSAEGITLVNPLGTENLGDLLGRLADNMIVISIPIVSIMVLVGAFQMLTAGGNPEKFKKGRDTIVYAAVGFAVVLLAKSVHLIIESIFR